MKLVEEIVVIGLFIAMAAVFLLIAADRAERINNGELIVVSEEYMDR